MARLAKCPPDPLSCLIPLHWLVTFFVIHFRENASLFIKVWKLFFGKDVGSNHLAKGQKVALLTC